LIKSKVKEFGADFSLLLVAIAWGGTFFIVQDAVEKTPVYIFLFWRFLFAAVLMGLIFYKHMRLLDKATLKAGVVLGIFLFLGFAFQTFGLTYTYSSTVAFITGLNVVIVPFIVFLFFKKYASIYSVFGAVIAVIGLYLLSVNENNGGLGLGEIYSFICAIMFALHISCTDFYSKKCNAMAMVTVEFAVVAILSLVGAVFSEGYFIPKSFNQTFFQALIITVLFATIFAFLVQTIMQKFTTPAKTAIIFTMEPVSAGVFGYYFADEVLGVSQLVGALLILAGMLLAELGTYFRKRRLNAKNT
jgi:drug/metabolite transporter (DMT)-like permease